MKYEWKKHEKEIYGVKSKPVIVEVPPMSFLMIEGHGDPNKEDFKKRIEVLMSLAYPIKMRYKKEFAKDVGEVEYDDYTVFPLEGVWSSTDRDVSNKDAYFYTIMIQQPSFITQTMVNEVMASVRLKKDSDLYKEVSFKTAPASLCAQILHTGPFDTEPESFAVMDDYISQQGYQRDNLKEHREIYLSDTRRVSPEKLRTILRYTITKAE